MSSGGVCPGFTAFLQGLVDVFRPEPTRNSPSQIESFCVWKRQKRASSMGSPKTNNQGGWTNTESGRRTQQAPGKRACADPDGHCVEMRMRPSERLWRVRALSAVDARSILSVVRLQVRPRSGTGRSSVPAPRWQVGNRRSQDPVETRLRPIGPDATRSGWIVDKLRLRPGPECGGAVSARPSNRSLPLRRWTFRRTDRL